LRIMTLPRVQPIAPTWRKEPFDDPDWLFEFKYDGFRALCYLEQRRNLLISRNNNIMTPARTFSLIEYKNSRVQALAGIYSFRGRCIALMGGCIDH
jgi:ATP-dependent DNA ligase